MKRSVTNPLLFLLLASRLACHAASAAPPASLPMLHAEGTDIVDPFEKPVILRGINLGGWLVEEMWMLPFVTAPPPGSAFVPIKDHVTLWNTVEKRFGPDGKNRVQTAYRQAWLNEVDFERLHAVGINCVRLPFLASLADEPGGLHWLDQAILWAGKNQIYVILDLHGAYGSQSVEQHTGQAGVNAFFHDPHDIAQTEALWTRLARRYQGNPTVAGYDTLNEPMGTPNSDTLYVVQDHLYQAIRAGDPQHLIFIEDGYTGVQWMPFPVPSGWTNVVYSTHYYNFGARSTEEQQKTSSDYVAAVEHERDRRQAPFYMGEYALEPHGTRSMLENLLQTLHDKHIASSMWTYKTAYAKGGQSLWGLYSNPLPITPLNPYRDSEADLIRKCAELRTDQMTLNPDAAQAFQNAALIGPTPAGTPAAPGTAASTSALAK